jgi:CheY-like chemotaxis protein
MGAIGFVSKPVSADQLNDVIGTIETALDTAVKRLLIVEDDANEAASLAALLAARGVDIALAGSGQQAIALLGGERFDCMVLDLGLPDMSGLTLLARIQDMEQARRIPVIVHSGCTLSAEQQGELQRYAESIIVKDANSPERLLNEVTLFLHMVERGTLAASHGLADAGTSDEPAALDGKVVLIVDDDMRNVFSLTSLLSDKGLRVLEAENGREALLRLGQHPEIAIVLMDIMMPDMDGYEAMRRIRAEPVWGALPVIAMTAKAMQGDQQKCFDAGASDYIAKPIDTDKLMSLLRVWCGR